MEDPAGNLDGKSPGNIPFLNIFVKFENTTLRLLAGDEMKSIYGLSWYCLAAEIILAALIRTLCSGDRPISWYCLAAKSCCCGYGTDTHVLATD